MVHDLPTFPGQEHRVLGLARFHGFVRMPADLRAYTNNTPNDINNSHQDLSLLAEVKHKLCKENAGPHLVHTQTHDAWPGLQLRICLIERL